MTNQEAIDELIIVRNVYDGMREAYKPCVDAIDMAISALKAQEETVSRKVYEQISWERDIAVMQLKDLGYGLGEKIRTDGDTISRQAAIDAVETKIKKWNAVDGEGYHVGLGLRYTDVIDTLTELPSAQPEPCGDVVSRNTIVQKLNEMDRYVSTELRLCDTDKKFPQNEVFIVDDVYEEIVENLESARPDSKETSFTHKALDTISRTAAIDAVESFGILDGYADQQELIYRIRQLPPAQPDGIPLEWIDKHLEWLDNCDNDFAQLAKVSIRTMVEIWKKDKT